MTSKRRNHHNDVTHESHLTPPCKTTFPNPGRVQADAEQLPS